MPIRRCAAWLSTAVVAALLSVSPARCEEPAAGVVVLRNGNVLAGTVHRYEGYYVVEHQGASLQVPADQVEMACASLVAAYERRRQERVGGSADAHLDLARWCVRNHLLDQAARETLDARVRDPGHPGITEVELQIRQALEIEAARRARAEQDRTAGAARLATPVQPEQRTPLLSPPVEAQTQFVRSIQPMLVQGCAVGGCHQPGAPQRLQLDRWALEGNGSPDLIRQNLESVLSQIDADDPASSPLIIRARKSHGNARDGQSRPLTSHQAAMLLDWLNAAAGVTLAPVEHSSHLAPRDESLSRSERPTLPAEFTPRDAFDPEIFNREIAAEAQQADLGAIGDAVEAAAAPM
jgi:hypothetical protein